jgi:ABC-2 type transport system permease protein
MVSVPARTAPTSTAPASAAPAPTAPTHARGYTFAGVLRSEWIKLRSLRSTWWSFGIVLVMQIAFAIVFAYAVAPFGGGDAQLGADMAVTAATIGTIMGQLVIAILGVLLMAGEFSTGQQLSSFLAVPTRLPVLWAKAMVLTAVTLITAMVSTVAGFLIAAPILRNAGYVVDDADAESWLRLGGAAAYLAFIGVIALGIGAVTRAPGTGIAITLAASLVLPSLLPLFGGTWAGDIISWLPGLAGQELFFWGASPVPSPFEPWQALLVMCGWSTLALATAAVTLRRRDA